MMSRKNIKLMVIFTISLFVSIGSYANENFSKDAVKLSTWLSALEGSWLGDGQRIKFEKDKNIKVQFSEELIVKRQKTHQQDLFSFISSRDRVDGVRESAVRKILLKSGKLTFDSTPVTKFSMNNKKIRFTLNWNNRNRFYQRRWSVEKISRLEIVIKESLLLNGFLIESSIHEMERK